jgi:hypothetical protein
MEIDSNFLSLIAASQITIIEVYGQTYFVSAFLYGCGDDFYGFTESIESSDGKNSYDPSRHPGVMKRKSLTTLYIFLLKKVVSR